MVTARGGGTVFWAAAVAAAVTVVSAQKTEAAVCGDGPTVAATVFAVLLLLALASLAIVMYQYIWKPRHCPSLEKVVLAENGQQEGRFAFDNPYMTEDDDIGSKSTLPCHDILAISEKTGTSRSGDFRTPKKHGFGVLTPTSSQPRGLTAEDSAINEADQVTVPLKGHDFTGLGFTVQGGMRDGIFVNTVSQHGPALESGLVHPGDRVTAVTVSFSHITLEDAMAILSQSSPYNVQLHLQKMASGGSHKKVPTPTGTGDRRQHSSTDSMEGKSHRTGRHDKSPATGSPSSRSSSNQQERKTAVETKVSENEPRKETAQHVQRDLSANLTDSVSGDFRERAVDVPEHMDSSHSKQEANATSGSSSAARARHLGVQVLPPLSLARGTSAGTEGPGGTGSEPREGPRSLALGVPSLRLATRDPADASHGVETCLTKLANDQPCSVDLDDETGEPSTPGAEEADHRRVRMGTSSFNKQERLERREINDSQPGYPEPAKRQSGAGDDTAMAATEAEKKAQDDSKEPDSSEVERSESPAKEQGLRASRHASSSDKETREKEADNEVEFKKLSNEFKTLIQEGKTQSSDLKTGDDLDRTTAEKKRQRSRSTSTSSSSCSDLSSPVQERPKQMSFDIPDEMRLAAGAAQDRRSRVDRPARGSMFSSTEVLVDSYTTPTEEHASAVVINLPTDEQETSSGERTPPVALPRTVTPDTHLSGTGEKESDSEKEDDSDSQEEDLKAEVKDGKLSSSSGEEEGKVNTPVEEEELQKTVRSNNAYQEDTPSSKVAIDKLEAFKEVLSLTPSKSPPEKRPKENVEVDVVGETVEKNHVDRCPCEGPTQVGTAPRITGDVTGLVEVGEKKSAQTTPVIVGVTENQPRVAPAASAAVSRARSEAAALPDAVRAARTVRRRDSGGQAAEPASRDAASTSGRLCSSTGDLTRSEPGRADSPLGRTVSMQIGGGDAADGESRVSAAACARDELDLSRVGQQEGYGETQSRHMMSTTSSNESLDTESIQEEPEEAADVPQPEMSNGTNGQAPEEDEETTAPAAVPIVLPSVKEAAAEVTVNGIGVKEEERTVHVSEVIEGVRVVPPALPRIVRSELKRNSESDSSDGREEPSIRSSPAALVSTTDDAITAPPVVTVAALTVAELSLEATTTPSSADNSNSSPSPTTAPSVTISDAAPLETESASEEAPVARSRRGPPPTPPPRSPASRQAAPPAPPREPDQFEISALELDSVLISHEDFLRQEAERRAHVCRLAANFRTSREPSPAPE